MNYSLLIFILLLLIYNKGNTDTDIVYFYDKESVFVKKEHVCLNNFEPSPFVDEHGQKFFSVEHYYQCHKFDNISDGEDYI